MQGTYRGHVLLEHGGGYVGSSSRISFLPELGLGLAVVANADRGGQDLCGLVSIDVYERLLADDEVRDPYADLALRTARPAGGPPDAALAEQPAPALAPGPGECAGVYRNEHFGTLVIEAQERGLGARLGELALQLTPTGERSFSLRSPGAFDGTGRLEVEGQKVVAVVLEVGDRTGLRFAK